MTAEIKKLKEILLTDNIVDSINKNKSWLLLNIPELKDMIGFPHNNPHHHLDVWNHTLYALSLSEKDLTIRLVLLLHDIGKPHSYQDIDGIRHYKNHQLVSAFISYKIMERLGLDKDYINKTCYLICNHDTKIVKEDIDDDILLTYKRYKIQLCDNLAHNPYTLKRRIKYLNETRKMFRKKVFNE